MEADLSEPNRHPKLSLVGDEPSRARAVDAERASESGQAADTHGPNPSLLPGSIVVNHDHAKTIYESAQYRALLYGTTLRHKGTRRVDEPHLRPCSGDELGFAHQQIQALLLVA